MLVSMRGSRRSHDGAATSLTVRPDFFFFFKFCLTLFVKINADHRAFPQIEGI